MSGTELPATVVPVEQREIDFYGDSLVVVRDEVGRLWLPLRRLCEAIGVNYQGQLDRVQRDPVIGDSMRSVRVTLTDGRRYEMNCLPLKWVRGWLFGITASRVRPEVRDKLVQYQREVIEIIDRHFSRPLAREGLDETMMTAMRDNALQQAKLWEMMLAEQRRLRATERFVEELDERVSDHDQILLEHERRIASLRELQQEQSTLLTRLDQNIRLLPAPSDPIGPADKAALKALVDDLVAAAQERGIRLGQGRNDYPAVWGAFKQRFDVARYDELPLSQLDDAVGWLKRWLDRVREGKTS